jgi:hypothetical protein
LTSFPSLLFSHSFLPRPSLDARSQSVRFPLLPQDTFGRQAVATQATQPKQADPFNQKLSYKVTPSASLKAGEWVPNVVPLHTVLMSLRTLDPNSPFAEERQAKGLLPEGYLPLLLHLADMPDSMQAAYLNAMLKINPKLSVVCAVHDQFLKAEPQAKAFISKHFGVPEKQLYLVPTEASVTKWAQDSAHPKLSANGQQLEWWEPRGQYSQSHTMADGLAAVGLGKTPQEAHFHGAGGDSEFVRDNKGKLWVAYGPETLLKTAQAYNLLPAYAKSLVGLNDKRSLELLGLALKTHAKDGVPLEQQLAVGLHPAKRTIGEALKGLNKEERQALRRKLGAEVYRALHQRKALELPQQAPKFHIDLMLRLMPEALEKEAQGKSGLSAIVADAGWDKVASLKDSLNLESPQATDKARVQAVSWLSSLASHVEKHTEIENPEEVLDAYNRLAQQLEQQGVRVTRLPRKSLPEQLDYSESPDLNYMNGQFVEHPQTKQWLYLMPTEAKEAEHLTLMDKLALRALKEAFPQVEMVPVGGETAVVHPEMGGGHCSFQILPVLLK